MDILEPHSLFLTGTAGDDMHLYIKHAGGRRVVAGKDTRRVETWPLELKKKARSGKEERAKISGQGLVVSVGRRSASPTMRAAAATM